ncbi:MAG: membrane protein insertase YidC [Acidobacteriota bacterium]
MQWRLLLAFLLTGLVMFLTPYLYQKFYGPPPKPAQKAPAAQKEAAPPAPAATPVKEAAGRKPATTAAKKAAGQRPAPVAAQKEETFAIETDLYRIELSNRGAVVLRWVLKKYNDSAGKPLELVNTAAAGKTGHPFSFAFKDRKPAVDVNKVLYVARPAADSLGIEYEYSDGLVAARKAFRFERKNYLSRFVSEVSEGGAGVPHLVEWRGGFGDPAVANPAASGRTLYYDLAAGKLRVNEAKAAKDGPVSTSGHYSFAGIQDTYFAAVFLPPRDGQIEIRTLSDTVRGEMNAKEEPHVGAGIGGAARNEFAVFVGPKNVDIMRQVDPKLEQVVDFGTWFGFIAKPLFLILNWANNGFVHNYGWSIVLLTAFINFALLPLKFSSMKSMKRMQALQPQIKAIQDRYKGIGLRDPRKGQQNQETMDLYKKHGVNPMGGCLPMALQIPFFIGFYNVLMVAIEMRGASWLWVSDLSQPENLPIRILPVTMIISQFVMQKMTPTTSADPAQQKLMLFMPLVFGFMFYHFSSGLVLYWLTSNLVGIAQQWFINKTSPVPAVVVQSEAKKKKGTR